MELKTRVDTYQAKFGEYGIVEIETIYNVIEENELIIRVKQDNADTYFRDVANIPGDLIYVLISTLEIAADKLNELSSQIEA